MCTRPKQNIGLHLSSLVLIAPSNRRFSTMDVPEHLFYCGHTWTAERGNFFASSNHTDDARTGGAWTSADGLRFQRARDVVADSRSFKWTEKCVGAAVLARVRKRVQRSAFVDNASPDSEVRIDLFFYRYFARAKPYRTFVAYARTAYSFEFCKSRLRVSVRVHLCRVTRRFLRAANNNRQTANTYRSVLFIGRRFEDPITCNRIRPPRKKYRTDGYDSTCSAKNAGRKWWVTKEDFSNTIRWEKVYVFIEMQNTTDGFFFFYSFVCVWFLN